MKGSQDIKRMQEKLAQAHEQRKRRRLREEYGPRLVKIINFATGKSLSLDDFYSDMEIQAPLNWSRCLTDTEGLVASYIRKSSAEKILACIQGRLGKLNGMMGFHDKPYLGLAHVNQVEPLSLLAVAESTKDSVVFYNQLPFGVLMVDCYVSHPAEPFSIVLQGDGFVSFLLKCFLDAKGG